jgi:hypothetical protein
MIKKQSKKRSKKLDSSEGVYIGIKFSGKVNFEEFNKAPKDGNCFLLGSLGHGMSMRRK